MEYDDIETTISQPDTVLGLPVPVCTDENALSADKCEIEGDWTYSVLQSNKKDLPNMISVQGFDLEIKPTEKLTATEEYTIDYEATSPNQLNFVNEVKAEIGNKVTIHPCFCKDYALSPVENVS